MFMDNDTVIGTKNERKFTSNTNQDCLHSLCTKKKYELQGSLPL